MTFRRDVGVRPMKEIIPLVVFCCLAVLPASAQDMCLRHGALAGHLAKSYSEEPASAGLDVKGRLFEMYVSPRGTWTMVVTTPRGMSCIRAVGKAWIRVPSAANVERPTF